MKTKSIGCYYGYLNTIEIRSYNQYVWLDYTDRSKFQLTIRVTR